MMRSFECPINSYRSGHEVDAAAASPSALFSGGISGGRLAIADLRRQKRLAIDQSLAIVRTVVV